MINIIKHWLEKQRRPLRCFWSIQDIQYLLQEIQRQFATDQPQDFRFCASMQIMDSSLQRSWLLATDQGLYFVVDILHEVTPRIIWHVHKNTYSKLVIRIEKYTDYTGLVSIVGKSYRKFSQQLFIKKQIQDCIADMVHAAWHGKISDK